MSTPTIRLAFLGAAQTRRDCGWRRVVERRTPLVFGSRSGHRALLRLRSEVAALGRPAVIDVRLVGYSWGAWTAIGVAKKLMERPQKIHPALADAEVRVTLGTLDPVGIFRLPARVPDGVEAYNVFQTNGCYQGCPGPASWFAGRPLEGAENRDVTDEGLDQAPSHGVPKEHAPDHIQLGYLGWGGYDERIASLLE